MRSLPREPIFYLFFVLTLLLILRLPSTRPVIPGQVDEAECSVMADTILNGQLIYRDAAHTWGPVTPYFYAFIFYIFGKNNITAIRFALILVIFCVNVILYLICILIKNRKLSFLVAFLFCVFSYTFHPADMLAFETEWLAVFFCLIGSYFLLRYYLRDKYLFIFLSGLFFGLAFFSKQLSLIIYFAALLFCGFFAYVNKKNIFASIKALSLNIAGFSLVTVAIFYYFYINNAFGDFWFWFWGYYSKYYVTEIPIITRIKISLLPLIMKGESFFKVNFLSLILFYLSVLIVTLKTFKLFRTTSSIGKELPVDWYFIFWGIFSYAATSYSGRPIGHYIIMVLPPLCLLGGKVIQSLFSSWDFSIKFYNPMALFKSLAKIFLVIFIIFGIFSPLKKYSGYLISSWDEYVHKKRPTNAFSEELRTLTAYIKKNTSEQEKIFVWGYYPEIYVLSDRMPASRYFNCNFLTGLIPWTNFIIGLDTSYAIIPGTWEILMEELKDNKPAYIVDTTYAGWGGYIKYPLEKFPELYNFIKDNYVLDAVVVKESQWVNFIVYKRR